MLSAFKTGKYDHIPRLAWADGLYISCPQYLLNVLLPKGSSISLSEQTITDLVFNREMTERLIKAHQDTLLHAAFTNTQPLSSRLPLNYQKIPAPIRDMIANIMGRRARKKMNSWAKFPTWPLDLSADFIADLLGQSPSPFATGPTPVLLTHDLDTPDGLKNLNQYFLSIEENVGARSANYIVPCAWKIDHGLLSETARRGHEIGIHGYDHSNKTPFLSSSERQKRLSAPASLINHYHIQGYRAPSLLRTQALLQDLANIYRYDSSIPTSGGKFPISNNGCASARPFHVAGIWEIPLSMPRDGSMLFLGYSPKEILNTWIQCADLIAKSGGIVNLLTHCEYRFSGKESMRKIYQQFLDYLVNCGKFKFMLPKEILPYLENC